MAKNKLRNKIQHALIKHWTKGAIKALITDKACKSSIDVHLMHAFKVIKKDGKWVAEVSSVTVSNPDLNNETVHWEPKGKKAQAIIEKTNNWIETYKQKQTKEGKLNNGKE